MNTKIEQAKQELIDTVAIGLKKARNMGRMEGAIIAIWANLIIKEILNFIYG